jgi:Protein of unknown function (DUF2971)
MSDRSDWKPLSPAFTAAVRRYEHASRARLLKTQERNAVTAPLYHYTTRGGLEGILTTDQIWFTHYEHLNDDTELKFGMDMAKSVLAEIAARVPQVKIFCDWTADLFSSENLRRTLGFYIASFSRNRDDPYQWERYGDTGRGFAIGLAPSLFAVVDNPNAPPLDKDFVSGVSYGEDAARFQHRTAIENITGIILEIVTCKAQAMTDKNRGMPFIREMAMQVLANELILYSLIVKEMKWAPEHEVRLVICGLVATLAPYVTMRQRYGDPTPVPTIKKDMRLKERGTITEIIIGPNAPPDSEKFVCSLLAPFHSDPGSIVRRSSRQPV